MHPSSPSLFYLCHFRSPSHPDGKPLSHSQLLPSLCFLHVISHCVLSALILNPHICSFFPFSLSSSLFETLSLLLGVGNLIGLFVSYLLISINHPTQLWSEQLPSQMPSGLIVYENYCHCLSYPPQCLLLVICFTKSCCSLLTGDTFHSFFPS